LKINAGKGEQFAVQVAFLKTFTVPLLCVDWKIGQYDVVIKILF